MIFIIGHGRHGKDTVAEFLKERFDLHGTSSSEMANELFMFDFMKDEFGYKTKAACYADRGNHRDLWYDKIVEYNTPDLSAMGKAISYDHEVYIGIRNKEELDACREEGLVDIVIGVYDPRKSLEPKSSMTIDIFEESDIIIPNSGTLQDLENRVICLFENMNIEKLVTI